MLPRLAHWKSLVFVTALIAPALVQDAKPGAGVTSPAKDGTAAAQSPDPQAKDAKDAKPEEPRGLRVHEPGASDGYTLLAPLNSHSIYLVDMDGKVVHTWETHFTPGGATYLLPNGHLLRCARREEPLRFHGGGIGGRIQEIDWDGTPVWEYELATDAVIQHHDLQMLPNGNLLMIAWEYHSPEEAAARGRDAKFRHEEGLWTDIVVEVQPTRPIGGKIVWTWRTWDHLVQDYDAQAANYGKPVDQPGRLDINADHRFLPKEETDEERKKREEVAKQMRAVGYAGGKDDDSAQKPVPAAASAAPDPAHKPADADKKPGDPDRKPADTDKKPAAPAKKEIEADWLHTNSIDYSSKLDLILLNSPHMGEFWIIDHSTTSEQAASESGGRWKHGGALLYRWGQSRNFGIGGPSTKKLYYEHDVTWLPGAQANEMRVLLFNNGSKRPGKEYSSVEEYVLPFDAEKGFVREPGKAFGPDAPVWSYSDKENFFSGFISGAEREANGDTLICEGAKGRVFEVTADGHIVWDFWSPLGGEIEPSSKGGKAPPHALFRAARIAKDHPGLKGKL